jgi:hypothetical protein
VGEVDLDGLLGHGAFVHAGLLTGVAGFGADLEAGSSGLGGEELAADCATTCSFDSKVPSVVGLVLVVLAHVELLSRGLREGPLAGLR